MRNKILKHFLFFIIGFFIVSIFYVFTSTLSYGNLTISNILYDIGRLLGLLGFLFLGILIIAGDLSRYLDKIFGMNHIILFQRKFAVFTLFFIMLHPIFFMLSSQMISNYIIPNFSALPLALGIISFYLFLIMSLASYFHKGLSNTIWQILHYIIYLLFFFGFYHAYNFGSDSNHILIKLLYVSMFIGFILGLVYRTYYKFKNDKRQRIKLKRIDTETEDTFTLVFDRPKWLRFKPGQFCFLRIDCKGLYARHPFTIASEPQDQELRFTIKNTGRFTNVAKNLNSGSYVNIDGPFGKFGISNTYHDIVMIAGGVGITPFISMVDNLIKTNDNRNIILLYGSQKYDNIIFKDKIDKIKNKNFKKLYILSEDENIGDFCEKGFLNKTILDNHVIKFHKSKFYICGPEIMKKAVNSYLYDFGVLQENIISEDFFW